jgi:hypothetical protein
MTTMKLLASILIALIASDAGGAVCPNCEGHRTVGEHGPVGFPCPVCEGSGTVPDQIPPAPVFAAAAPDPSGVEPRPSQPTVGRPRPVVARVTAGHAGPSMDMGSGVLVRVTGTVGIVLTNWHVVRGHRDDVKVAWPDGSQTTGRVVAWDDAWDLAAISVPRPDAYPVQIAAQAPKIGDRLTIAGFGVEGRYLEQAGEVTEYLSPTRGHPKQWIECRAAARNGDSGGPMFNASGELAGVLFGEARGLTCGSCSTRLRLFLASVPAAPGSASQLAAATPTSATVCPTGKCPKR